MPQFEPVAGTNWRRADGVHAGSVYRIASISDTSVRVIQAKSNHGGGNRSEARHKWPREDFLRMFVPDTARDERACLPVVGKVQGMDVVAAPPGMEVQAQPRPITVTEAVEVMKLEERIGGRIDPVFIDTNTAGDEVQVPIASKRCPQCGEKKALALFGSNRAQRDGLSTHCRACRAAQYQTQRAKEENRSVTLTTTSNQIIEQRQQPGSRNMQEHLAAHQAETPAPRRANTRVFRVKVLVMEERELRIEAASIPEAYDLAQAQNVEVVSVALDGSAS